jgi:hypothetical protein
MAAEILEQLEDTTPTDAIPTDEQALTQEDLVTDLAPADTMAPPQVDPEDDIPDKYKGKSIKEVIGMHQSAESLIGTQGSEVGELRKVVDGYIQSQLQTQTPEPPEAQEPVDFFEDPAKAVSQAIETHPDVVNARQQAQEMKRTSSLTQLQAKHPDMQQVLQAPAFAEWVKNSPVRMELYDRADKGFDFNAADELVSNFKERAATAQQAVQTETAARQQAVRAASTGSATGTGNAGSKRVYRRADIIKLMKTDPDRYEALNPEIMLAYQEGRVR